MKSSLHSSQLKATLLIIPLALCFGGSTVAQAGGNDPLSPGPVRPGNWNYRTELPQGYLKVYSATDKFKDGAAWYFPHSPYAIYAIGGKLVKNVENRRSPDDEIPEVVALPVGTYAVVARSEKHGTIHALVVIKEAQQTILDLDRWETSMSSRLAHN
jgi:hypothetical protein